MSKLQGSTTHQEENMLVVPVTRISELESVLSRHFSLFVLDFRKYDFRETSLVKQVIEVLAKHTSHNIQQIWLANTTAVGVFFDFNNRLKNSPDIARYSQKVILVDPEASYDSCITLGNQVCQTFSVLDNWNTTVEAHPSVHRLILDKIKARKRKKSNTKDIEEHPINLQSNKENKISPYVDNRRPTKATIGLIKKFKEESKPYSPADQKPSSSPSKSRRCRRAGSVEGRRCYMCHHKGNNGIGSCCLECSELNTRMREAQLELTGRFALVTGGRVKIGLEVALRLLRGGCTVVVTTRFPASAHLTYSSLPDYSSWNERLHIFGLDLQVTQPA